VAALCRRPACKPQPSQSEAHRGLSPCARTTASRLAGRLVQIAGAAAAGRPCRAELRLLPKWATDPWHCVMESIAAEICCKAKCGLRGSRRETACERMQDVMGCREREHEIGITRCTARGGGKVAETHCDGACYIGSLPSLVMCHFIRRCYVQELLPNMEKAMGHKKKSVCGKNRG
jgi:hypothetical protein